jgi:hypothetical protein
MAKARFKTPVEDIPRADDENLNVAPPVVPPCRYLREKATGDMHHYSEWMAKRGDLVEGWDGELDAAPPLPPAQDPAPPPVRHAAPKDDDLFRREDIPHSPVGLKLNADR